jgi:hypothetical protein
MEGRADSVAQLRPPWAATTGEVGAGLECDLVYSGVGTHMAPPTEGLAAGLDCALLFLMQSIIYTGPTSKPESSRGL